MNRDPISVAFESVEVDPSPVFREQLRARFMTAMAQPESSEELVRERSDARITTAIAQPEDEEDIMVKVVDPELGYGSDSGGREHAAEPGRSPRRRMQLVLGVAASIALVATLAVVIINHKSKPAVVDTTHDPEIAKAAIISPSALGAEWAETHIFGDLTSRSIAESAATVEACEPYLDAAFDTAGRQAVTAGRHFAIPGGELVIWMITQWVTIFPSEKAASQAMDKIAEPGFPACFDSVFRRMYGNSDTARLNPVPIAAHGDRQIVIGQHLGFGIPTPGGGVEGAQITTDAMNVWVQVGRAIVFVDPTTDFHDSLDPGSRIERAVSGATNALKVALDQAPG